MGKGCHPDLEAQSWWVMEPGRAEGKNVYTLKVTLKVWETDLGEQN